MKSSLLILVMALSAVAYASDKPSTAEQAMQECQTMADPKTNRTAFDACMKAKGFERPKA